MKTIRTNTAAHLNSTKVPAGVPIVPAAKQSPQMALETFVSFGRSQATAALAFVCSGVNFFCVVNHFASANDGHYLSMDNARDKLKAELGSNTALKASMLYRYVAFSARLYTALTKGNRHAAVLKAVADAKDGATAVKALTGWLDTVRVRSLNDLEKLFGADAPTGTGTRPAKTVTEQAQARVSNAVKSVEKEFVAEGKVKEREVAQAIASAVSDPIALILEAIVRITKPADLDRITRAVSGQAERLVDLTERATKATGPVQGDKAPATAPVKTKAKTKRPAARA
jgi:hypothetical protein